MAGYGYYILALTNVGHVAVAVLVFAQIPVHLTAGHVRVAHLFCKLPGYDELRRIRRVNIAVVGVGAVAAGLELLFAVVVRGVADDIDVGSGYNIAEAFNGNLLGRGVDSESVAALGQCVVVVCAICLISVDAVVVGHVLIAFTRKGVAIPFAVDVEAQVNTAFAAVGEVDLAGEHAAGLTRQRDAVVVAPCLAVEFTGKVSVESLGT